MSGKIRVYPTSVNCPLSPAAPGAHPKDCGFPPSPAGPFPPPQLRAHTHSAGEYLRVFVRWKITRCEPSPPRCGVLCVEIAAVPYPPFTRYTYLYPYAHIGDVIYTPPQKLYLFHMYPGVFMQMSPGYEYLRQYFPLAAAREEALLFRTPMLEIFTPNPTVLGYGRPLSLLPSLLQHRREPRGGKRCGGVTALDARGSDPATGGPGPRGCGRGGDRRGGERRDGMRKDRIWKGQGMDRDGDGARMGTGLGGV